MNATAAREDSSGTFLTVPDDEVLDLAPSEPLPGLFPEAPGVPGWRGRAPDAPCWALAAFIAAHRALDDRAFAAAHPHMLVLLSWEGGHGSESTGTFETTMGRSLAELRLEAESRQRVYPLAHRGEHDFAFMTLGRAANNDLVIDHHAVSKCHLIFREKNGVLTVSDTGSTNGTRLDGRPLTPREPTQVGDGDSLEVGQVATLELLSSWSFHERYLQ